MPSASEDLLTDIKTRGFCVEESTEAGEDVKALEPKPDMLSPGAVNFFIKHVANDEVCHTLQHLK
jgi:hypothetical protein